MQYGLRYYETSQRLWWFVLLLFCFLVAYPASKGYVALSASLPRLQVEGIQIDTFKTLEFWKQKQWISESPLGQVIVYLALVAYYYWLARLAWLVLQWVGKELMHWGLKSALKDAPDQARTGSNWQGADPAVLLNNEALRKVAGPVALRWIFNAHKRLHLLLLGGSRVPSSESLMQRESRLESVDWQLLSGSWEPYKWIVRLLPLLGVAQSGWILYLHLQPVLDGGRELQTIPAVALISLIPVVQVVVAMVALSLAQGLLERLENFYLAKLDALFYDRLLSRLPLQSSDTVLLLKAMEKHFERLHKVLNKLERKLSGQQDGPNQPS